MAEEGARVVIVAQRPEVLKAAAEEIKRTATGEVQPVQGDVTDQVTVTRVVSSALNRFGRIDILVNNAGTAIAKPFEAVSDDEWESDFNLKVWAAIRFIRAVIPEFRKPGLASMILEISSSSWEIALLVTAVKRVV
jgi:3-oxoacyl-[acyl-carrier protein] reductase